MYFQLCQVEQNYKVIITFLGDYVGCKEIWTDTKAKNRSVMVYLCGLCVQYVHVCVCMSVQVSCMWSPGVNVRCLPSLFST